MNTNRDTLPIAWLLGASALLREGESQKRVYPDDAQLNVIIRWIGGADCDLGWYSSEQAMELVDKLKAPMDRYSSLPSTPLGDEFEIMAMDSNRCRVVMTERETPR